MQQKICKRIKHISPYNRNFCYRDGFSICNSCINIRVHFWNNSLNLILQFSAKKKKGRQFSTIYLLSLTLHSYVALILWNVQQCWKSFLQRKLNKNSCYNGQKWKIAVISYNPCGRRALNCTLKRSASAPRTSIWRNKVTIGYNKFKEWDVNIWII